MVTSLRRREEWLGRISCRIERCEAASQEALSRPSPPASAAGSMCPEMYLLLQRVHISSRSTSAPVLTAPEHQVVAAAAVTAIPPGLQLSVCLLPTHTTRKATDRKGRH
jgi:hypothetical protein